MGEQIGNEKAEGLSSELIRDLYNVLISCPQFSSFEQLETVFLDNRISFWGDDLPYAQSTKDRVYSTINYLLGKYDTNDNPALLLFLQALSERIHYKDRLHQKLQKLINAFELPNNISSTHVAELSSPNPKQQEKKPSVPGVLNPWRIVLISSTDVEEEKKIFKSVVEEMSFAARLNGIYIELFCEDDIVPSFGDPCEVRLKQFKLEEANLVVFIAWYRLESCLKQALETVNKLIQGGIPLQVAGYYCGRSVPQEKIGVETVTLKQLMIEYFRTEGNYREIDDFKDQVRQHLTKFLNEFMSS